MKYITLFAFIFCIASVRLQAQTPVLEWATRLGGGQDTTGETSSPEENLLSIYPHPQGGYIAAGSAAAGSDIITGFHYGNYPYDFWLTRTDDTGAVIWGKAYGGSRYDVLTAMTPTGDGGYILVGNTLSSDGDISSNSDTLNQTVWVVKVNDTGALEWEKTYGGSGYDYAYSVIQTQDGGYAFAGYTTSNDGDVTVNHGEGDFWVVKLNDTGAISWEHSYGGSADDGACSIVQTPDGDYAVGGYSLSSDGDLLATLTKGNMDYWLIKIDGLGNLLWNKCYGGSAMDQCKSMTLTADGGYILTGLSRSSDLDVNNPVAGVSRIWWTVKTDSLGSYEWDRGHGGSGYNQAEAVMQAKDGGYLVSGYIGGAGGTTDAGFVSGRSRETCLLKLDAAGIPVWQRYIGTSTTDWGGFALAQNDDGSVLMAGPISSLPGSTDYMAISGERRGNGDGFIVKYAACPAYTYYADTICAGDTYTLGAQVLMTSGQYSDTFVMTSTGCDSLVLLSLFVDSLEKPVINATGNVLSTEGSYSLYQWLDGGNNPIAGANSATFEAINDGNYRVVVWNARGCSDTSEVYSHTATGLGTMPLKGRVKLYPNPVKNILYIESGDPAARGTICIYGVDGLLRHRQSLSGATTAVSTEMLVPGLYLLKIGTPYGTVVKKLLKQ